MTFRERSVAVSYCDAALDQSTGVYKLMNVTNHLDQTTAPVRFPVSVKAVVIHKNEVVLLKNERDEWELPGGKLELGEEPQLCVVREVEEELGLKVAVSRIIDSWQYHIREGRDVVIITYACSCSSANITKSPEHKEARWFALENVHSLRMPDGYKKSIADWSAVLQQINSYEKDRDVH
jgi:mutator protein MutT